MQNNIAALSIKDLLNLGDQCATTAQAIGLDAGLAQNKAVKILADFSAANDCFRALQTELANRVAKAAAFEDWLGQARSWGFSAKNTLKPFLGESHNSLYRPTGFVSSLRVAEDYDGLLALTDALQNYFEAHADQTNANPKVNVTTARAEELYDGLKAAKLALDDQNTLIREKQQEQDDALAVLRDRLRGVIGELKQLLPEDDQRWRRFGFNIPAEPETPVQPEQVQVDDSAPGKLLVTCAPVPFAERYRCYAARVGSTLEPVPVGSSSEPLFVIESLEAGGRYNVLLSAVNSSGNEGPRSEVTVAEVRAQAAA